MLALTPSDADLDISEPTYTSRRQSIEHNGIGGLNPILYNVWASDSFIIKETILNFLLSINEYGDSLIALPINKYVDGVPLFSLIPLHHILHIKFLVIKVAHPIKKHIMLLFNFDRSISLFLFLNRC